MWSAIFITVLAAAGNNIGKVLQKQATRTLPKLTLKKEVIHQYLQSKTWLAGTIADLSGALLMIVAFALAPVSVVQPVSGIGLVLLLIFSHFYLKERLRLQEWVAAAIAGAGVLGLGLSAEPDHWDHPTMHGSRIFLAFLTMLGLLVVECWWRHNYSRFAQRGQTKASAAALASLASTDAILCGLEAGACFGFSAAACRTGFILAHKLTWLWVPLGLLASVVLTTSGFVLQTKGLKTGNTVIVCTMAAVASMISGVLAGLIALDEKMPSTHGLRVIRLTSWVLILLGVSSLAGGQDGLLTVVRALAQHMNIPQWMWRYIPRPLALVLHKAGKRLEAQDELPLVEPHEMGSTATTV